MAFNKSREQCVVRVSNRWKKVTNKHIGMEVYDKKTGNSIGILIDPNPITKMLRLRLHDGTTVTIK